MKPSLGHDHARVRDRRFGNNAGDVAAGQFSLDGVEVVVGDETDVAGGVAQDAAALRNDVAGLVEDAEEFVGVAVVLTDEHQDVFTAGHGPGNA